MSVNHTTRGAVSLFDWSGAPESWQVSIIENHARVRRGASPRPAGDPRYFGGEFPWIKIGDATKSPGKYLYSTEESLNDEGAKKSVLIPKDSLIIANSGVSLGFAVITKIEGCIHDGWLVLDEFNGVDKVFLYYLINFLTDKFRNFASGTTQPNLNTGILKKLQFPVPPLDEQVNIAKFLEAIDDKIENNRQINQTLEQIAQAIFKSWFVDFDPVHAKVQSVKDGRSPLDAAAKVIGNPALEPIGASLQEIAALFPSELEESEVGLVPKGWRVSCIGDEVSIFGGATPSTKNPAFWDDGKFSWATPKDLSGLTDKILQETERKITQQGVDKISSGQLPKGTVLMSSRAPVGYLALATVPVSVNQGFIAMVCDKLLPNYYVLQWAESKMDEIKSRASGTTFAEINKKNFRSIPVVVPEKDVLSTYVGIMNNFYNTITCRLTESKSLSSFRDALLPKLLSGEIRVNDAENQIAEVV